MSFLDALVGCLFSTSAESKLFFYKNGVGFVVKIHFLSCIVALHKGDSMKEILEKLWCSLGDCAWQMGTEYGIVPLAINVPGGIAMDSLTG